MGLTQLSLVKSAGLRNVRLRAGRQGKWGTALERLKGRDGPGAGEEPGYGLRQREPKEGVGTPLEGAEQRCSPMVCSGLTQAAA